MRRTARFIAPAVLAAAMACCLPAAISLAQTPLEKEQSLELFRTGVQYFDKGIDASNLYNYNNAKKYVRLALSIFLTSRALDPGNSYAKGFIYLAKGFMYHLSGTQMRLAIQTDSDPYTVLVQLRRAYYPLEHAQFYYDHSLEYITDPATRTYIEGMRARNNEEVKLVRQFLPQVDYKADRFMNTIETEAACIVTFDKINDMITEKNYAAIPELIKKNRQLAKKLESLKSDNAVGFKNLTNAYENLLPVLQMLGGDDASLRADQAFLAGKLDACIQDTRVAEQGFRDLALSDLCDSLREVAMKIKSALRKRTGVTI